MRNHDAATPNAVLGGVFPPHDFYAPRGGVLQITKCSSSECGNLPIFYCALEITIGHYQGVFSGGCVS
jgi:hypothetical protein